MKDTIDAWHQIISKRKERKKYVKKIKEEKHTNAGTANITKIIMDIKRDHQLYIMILPVIAWYIVWCYFPMYGLQIAFKDYSVFKGIADSPWVGLKYFKQFFSSIYAWRVIKNTLVINIIAMFTNFPLTIILALLLNELRSKIFKTGVQTVLYLPHFISTVVVAGMVVMFLSPSTGIINNIISALGGSRKYFLIDPNWFRPIFVIMNGWKGIGFGTIIYTSALASIDQTLYEAAEVDGANRLKKAIHITLPGILPTISVMLILRLGQLLSLGSEAILLLYNPITYEKADVISTYVYRSGLVESNYSLACAVGVFQGVIALILMTVANSISRKINEVGIW